MHFVKADEIMARNSRRAVRAPSIMSKYYRAILDLLTGTGICCPAHAGRVDKWPRNSPSSFATRSSDAKNRSHHRRRNFRSLSGRAAGERQLPGACPRGARKRPAAAAVPISTRLPISPSTTAIICCCRAIVTRWPMPARSAPRRGWSGRSARSFRSPISATGPALAARPRRRPACRSGCSMKARRVPDTGLLDYLALAPSDLGRRGQAGRQRHPLRGHAVSSGWCSRCCSRRSTVDPPGRLGRACRRDRARDAAGGRTGLPAADRARRLERGADRAGRSSCCRKRAPPSGSDMSCASS
mgnify:CR=1 FL=1